MQRETTSSVSPRGTKYKAGQSIRKQEGALRKVRKTENEDWLWFPELSKSRGSALLLMLKELAVSPWFSKVNGNDFCVVKYQSVAGSNEEVISNQYSISYPKSSFWTLPLNLLCSYPVQEVSSLLSLSYIKQIKASFHGTNVYFLYCQPSTPLHSMEGQKASGSYIFAYNSKSHVFLGKSYLNTNLYKQIRVYFWRVCLWCSC